MTTAYDLLDRAEALFLDFDGPVAALMPPPVNAEAAANARRPLAGEELPLEIESSTDHLAVLRWARANCNDELLAEVQLACTAAEVAAAGVCSPSLHAESLLAFAESRQLPVAVVSNNSDACVRAFLERFGWLQRVHAIACRTPSSVDMLKPKPDLLLLAADTMKLDVGTGLFIGDSVSDVIAGKAAGMTVLGLAKNTERAVQLLEAGAEAVSGLRAAITFPVS